MPYAPRESVESYARFKVLARSWMRDAPSLAPWMPERDPIVNAMYREGVVYADQRVDLSRL